MPFTNVLVQAYAAEVAQEERNHVSLIQSALGSAAVAQPQIDLYNSFNYLGTLLGLSGFDPFADDASFLIGSYIFEDVGVTAYGGAVGSLTVAADVAAAASIHAVEGYHAGLVRTTLVALDQNSNLVTSLGGMVPPGTLMATATKISAARAFIDGAKSVGSTSSLGATLTVGDDIGLQTQTVMLNGTTGVTASTLVDASTTGSLNVAGASGTAGSLAFTRTAQQVLNIVYAGKTAAGNQGFFPVGLNGNVK